MLKLRNNSKNHRMIIEVITLFPEMFEDVLDESILKRAQEKKLVEIKLHNLRDWAKDKHRTVDDRPYGGGPGMVLKVDVVEPAIREVVSNQRPATGKVILLSPQGKKYNQKIARKLAQEERLILVAGHYEGFDERIREFVDEEISIGDYILTGGELPAMVIIDSVVRLIPGVLGDEESTKHESFEKDGLLDFPNYTRPLEYKGLKVPEILLSGHHAEIEKWRRKMAEKKSKKITNH